MSTLERSPSDDQIREASLALEELLEWRLSAPSLVREREDTVIPLFLRLAVALRPLRDAVRSPDTWPRQDWPDVVRRALVRAIEVFDATSTAWGWNHLVSAPDHVNQSFVDTKRYFHQERYGRAYYQALLAWRANDLAFPERLDADADFGRDVLGCRAPAGMTPEKARAGLEKAHEGWYNTPIFGTTSPIIPGELVPDLCVASDTVARAVRTRAESPERSPSTNSPSTIIDDQRQDGSSIHLDVAGSKSFEPRVLVERPSNGGQGEPPAGTAIAPKDAAPIEPETKESAHQSDIPPEDRLFTTSVKDKHSERVHEGLAGGPPPIDPADASQLDPIRASGAEIAKAMGRKKTGGFLEDMQKRKILRYEKIPETTHVKNIWFINPNEHKRVEKVILGQRQKIIDQNFRDPENRESTKHD